MNFRRFTIMDNFGATRNMETAIIPKGTVINGNVVIEGKLEMYGVVNGDIKSDSRVNISGDVTGNIRANDLYAKDSFIVGQIECVQGATIRENTVILGDIMAENLVVDGAIQGKIDIKESVTVGNTAILDSDIRARTIQVNNGAAINGHCSLCYADIKLEDVFPVTEEEVQEPAKDETPADETKETKEPEEVKEPEAVSEDKPKAVAKPRAIAKPKAVKKADAEAQ